MEISTDEMAKACIDMINAKIKNMNKLNIIVVGKSGVGKSTLINSLFRGNFAATSVGRPVTNEIRKIEKQDYPMAIYDTPGFELSKEQQVKVRDEIHDLINKGIASGDISEAIHCIWYCVNVGGNRTFDETEVTWLRELTENSETSQVPVIVVLTQACPKKKASEMKSYIEKENLNIVKVVPVLAQDMDFDGEYVAKSYGLDKLIDIMSETLPDELQETLQNIQKASLDAKKKHAHIAVATAVAAATAAGAVPIPFADAVVLVPIQVTMLTSITVIFGLEISESFLTGFVSSTLGTAGTTVLGKTVVSSLIKMIPGIGSLAGGAISATTAGLLTTALGEVYIKVMELIYKGEMKREDLSSKEGKETMKRLFQEELKNKK